MAKRFVFNRKQVRVFLLLCLQWQVQVGGSSAVGTWGYLQAVEEMRQQTVGLGITDIAMVSLVSLQH